MLQTNGAREHIKVHYHWTFGCDVVKRFPENECRKIFPKYMQRRRVVWNLLPNQTDSSLEKYSAYHDQCVRVVSLYGPCLLETGFYANLSKLCGCLDFCHLEIPWTGSHVRQHCEPWAQGRNAGHMTSRPRSHYIHIRFQRKIAFKMFGHNLLVSELTPHCTCSPTCILSVKSNGKSTTHLWNNRFSIF